jgi:LPXTG-motif cell wall-anchored protein
MKRLIIATTLAVAFITFAGMPAAATGVRHPSGECDGVFIKDQPPFSGLSVTAAYTGNMWIKIATQHVAVPVVTKGDVITPSSLSSWPTNRNGHPQEVSHVDYCIEPPTETTIPETTIPETTVPETTVPETTVPETTVPEECVPEGIPVTDTETGDVYWYLVPGLHGVDSCGDPIPNICVKWGEDSYSRLWTVEDCTPTTVTTTPPTTPTTTPPKLPDTGSDPWTTMAAAAALMLAGGGALTLARRR